MTSPGIKSLATLSLLLMLTGRATSLAQSSVLDGDVGEALQIIRTNLTGISEAEFQRRALQGVVSAFEPRVSLGSRGTQTALPPLAKAHLLDGEVGYFRVGNVEAGLAELLRVAYDRMSSTGRIRGVVIDLRYSGGHDYAAAAAVTDLFLQKRRPLLTLQTGAIEAKDKSQAIGVPVAVLVNKDTTGSSEALAAVMRQTGVALVLGAQTAGNAAEAKHFQLQGGEKLSIATSPIRLGDGSLLTTNGVQPDVVVEVAPTDERAYYADAFRSLRTNTLPDSTNASAMARGPRRARFGEAELERERREGADAEPGSAGRATEVDRPVISDPVLARAVDVLKGLAVIRQSRF